MIRKITPKFLFPYLTFLFFSLQIQAQTGCPDCQTNLPTGLPDDTIYLDEVPSGELSVPYDEDLSFRLPKTTTPVAATDSTVLPNIPLDEIKITAINNLPPGLSWQPNKETYDLPDDTDGCAKICGTPLLPGIYTLEIVLEVKISFLTQTTSFERELVIEGGTTNNDGFSTDQSIGCGELAISFQNNNPSNGNSGYSYSWDFGNGVTSIDENPSSQTYAPGSYEVVYQATFDTVGYFLTNVTVTSSDCNDILSELDLFIEIEDPDGNIFMTGDIPNTDPPVQFPLNYEIGEGNYTLTIKDSDSGINGNDDVCGVYAINQLSGGIYSSGGSTISITITHPVGMIETKDSIHVYPNPAPLVIGNIGLNTACDGDSVVLTASTSNNFQWNLDGSPIAGATENELVTKTSGIYSVTTTNEFGCSATSETTEITFYENPPEPEFLDETTNILSLDSGFEILPEYNLQWYFEDAILAGETNAQLCINDSGIYTLEVTNVNTGCVNEYSADGVFDETYFCGAVNVDELLEKSLKIFPNPFQEQIFVELEFPESVLLKISLTDMLGRKTILRSAEQAIGFFQETFNLNEMGAGVYFLEIEIDDEKILRRVIKQ